MRAVLHIGTEKTGTTAIQSFLFANRALLHELGYHVVTSAGERNNRWIPSACMALDRSDDFVASLGGPEERRARTRQFRARFDAELRGLPEHVHTVIISSEHLHSRLVRQEEVDAVGDLLDDYVDDVQVIAYLRRQIDMCVSLYSTALKVGQSPSLEAFLNRCRPDDPYYDYAGMLALWAARFGRKSMTVRLFDRSHMHRGDLLDDFCHSFAPALVGRLPKEVDDANESLVPTGQALARAVNRVLGTRDDAAAADRALRQQAFDLISSRLAGKGEQPSPERWASVQEAFTGINETVMREYFPDLDDLFPGGPPPRPAADVGDDFVDAVVDLLRLVRG